MAKKVIAKKRPVGRPKMTATEKAKSQNINKMIRKAFNEAKKTKGYENFKAQIEALKSEPSIAKPYSEYVTFKHKVLESKGKVYKGRRKTLKGAIKKVLGSHAFIAPKERNIINLYAGIRKNFPSRYNEIKRFLREGGTEDWQEPENHTVWVQNEDVYWVTNAKGQIMEIDLVDSPKDVHLKVL